MGMAQILWAVILSVSGITACASPMWRKLLICSKQVCSARFLVLSATLPEDSEYFVAYDCEPVVCTLEMVEALAQRCSTSR